MERNKIQKINIETNEITRSMMRAYFSKDSVVSDFSQIPSEIKLSYLQKTPSMFIRYRNVDGTEIPYISHDYAEKALNFISNFNWGSQKISSEIIESKITTKKGKLTTRYSAMVEMLCWIYIGDRKIERYIASGHNAYENVATTKADCLQSAISKAHTKFARQLGIGTNIQGQEETAYERIEKHYEIINAEDSQEIKEQKRIKDYINNVTSIDKLEIGELTNYIDSLPITHELREVYRNKWKLLGNQNG